MTSHACLSNDLARFVKYCRPINISSNIPLDLAIPIYGYIYPCTVAIALGTTLCFLAFLWGKKKFRNDFNFVLLIFAFMELFVGLVGLPWNFYFYTLKGYEAEAKHGLSTFWCGAFEILNVAPGIFHAASIWLTVYLIIITHRTFHKTIDRYESGTNTTRVKVVTILVCFAAFVFRLPEILASGTQYLTAENATWLEGRPGVCVRKPASWVIWIGVNYFYGGMFILLTVFVYILPSFYCTLISGLQYHFIHTQITHLTTREMSHLKAEIRLQLISVLLFLILELPASFIHFVQVLRFSGQWEIGENFKSFIVSIVILRNLAILLFYPIRLITFFKVNEEFRKLAILRKISIMKREVTSDDNENSKNIELKCLI